VKVVLLVVSSDLLSLFLLLAFCYYISFNSLSTFLSLFD